MTIRTATPADVPRLLELARGFLTSSDYGRLFTWNAAQMQALITMLLDAPAAAIFVAELPSGLEGLLAIVALPHPMTGQLVAEELAWWVEPAYRAGSIGPRLLLAAERWACTKSAALLKMAAPHESSVGGFLTRRGYEPVETHYTRRI